MDTSNLAHMATVANTVKWSGISRSRLYELVKARKIEARKAGRRTLIVTDTVVRWLDSLPSV
jgi:excisionase family DNA binding protein